MPRPPAPEKFIAFLRAINVGGRTVKMNALRQHFEAFGFANVETFIASGNVRFSSKETNSSALEAKIEKHLRESLGFEVTTMLRTATELAAIANYRPFSDDELNAEGHSMYIAFLQKIPSAEAVENVVNLRTEFDEFHVHDREIYWLCRTRFSDSKITGPRLEKAAGMPATARNSTTVRKLAALYPASS